MLKCLFFVYSYISEGVEINMNQNKIGQFIKQLRKEKGLTQEQLSEILGVTNRSVSRWENGVNMPDFDLVVEIANYFDVSIDEFLDGERKENRIDKKENETLLKVSDYNNIEKIKIAKRIHILFIASLIAFLIYSIIDFSGLEDTAVYRDIATYSMGLIFGVLLVGTLYTSKYFGKIKAFKQRIRKRNTQQKTDNPESYKRRKNILIISCLAFFCIGALFIVAALLTKHHTAFSPGVCFLGFSISMWIQLKEKCF